MLSNKTRVIAIIPARGGSKGLPRKNLAMLAGKPLIEYTITSAQKSKFIDEVWVSSDDDEILCVSKMLGADILKRPKKLSEDTSSAADVVNHFIGSMADAAKKQDPLLLYLQPTSPLRNEMHIDSLLNKMELIGAVRAMSVVAAEKPPHKSFIIDNHGHLQALFDERLSNARRQDLPRCYFPNGAIYAFRISGFENRNCFPSNGSMPYIMSTIDSVDIDNISDLNTAETIMREKNA